MCYYVPQRDEYALKHRQWGGFMPTDDTATNENISEEGELESNDQQVTDEAEQPEGHVDDENSSTEETESPEESEESRKPRGKRRNQRLHKKVDELTTENSDLQQQLEQIKQKIGIQEAPVNPQAAAQQQFDRAYRRNYKGFEDDLQHLIDTNADANKMMHDKTEPIMQWEPAAWNQLIVNDEDPAEIYEVAKHFPEEVDRASFGNAASQVKAFGLLKNKLRRKRKDITVANRIKNSPEPTGVVEGRSFTAKTRSMGDAVERFKQKTRASAK